MKITYFSSLWGWKKTPLPNYWPHTMYGGGINLLNKVITPERAAAIAATACLSL